MDALVNTLIVVCTLSGIATVVLYRIWALRRRRTASQKPLSIQFDLYGRYATGLRRARSLRDEDYVFQNRMRDLVATLRNDPQQQATPTGLIRFRRHLRELGEPPPLGGMLLALVEPEMRLLSVWLLGRFHKKLAVPVLCPMCHDPSPQMRKHAARALFRLGAWSELRAMAQHETDPRVLRWLEPRERKPLEERLSRFLGEPISLSETSKPQSRMPLWTRLPIGPGRPPKTAEYIRMLLERIRAHLRGLAGSRNRGNLR